MNTDSSSNSVLISVKKAYDAFLALGKFKAKERSRAVEAMALGMKESINEILEANTLDLESSLEMAVPDTILNWLKLTRERLETTVEILNRIAELSDPLQRVINTSYQFNFCQTYYQRMPLGVIALIYQAFPELGAITAAMCIKTGNSLILRGGSEASHSNAVIASVLKNALIDADLPPNCLQFISPEQGISMQDLLVQDQYLNLVIPYGRPSLIQEVTKLANAPVLRSAMGNCYLYWSPSGDLDLVRSIILDSHVTQPDAVNAIEKVLINANQKPTTLVRLFHSLKEKNFKLRGENQLVKEFPEYLSPLQDQQKKIGNQNELFSEWETPYLEKIVAFKAVDSITDGINWINKHSSSHADCIVTESYEESRQFATEIDSALVYINSSPRFYRYPKTVESVFLGISNQKGQRRGLISLETLTTLKQVFQGDGRL